MVLDEQRSMVISESTARKYFGEEDPMGKIMDDGFKQQYEQEARTRIIFTIFSILSILVTWPLAYFITRNWLNDFAYRIDLGITPFLLSFVVALLISLATISVQAITAALKNPADSLRYE